MKAKKKFGQNFLVDRKTIDTIIDSIFAKEEDLIIEIGPGKGALTKELKKKKSYVLAYEIDLETKSYLSSLEDDKTKIIYQDILKANIVEDIKNYTYNSLFIVGNLPYYITTPIIEKIIAQGLDFSSFTIMVQKEVADRFMASPKTKEYGYFTLFLKYYFDISFICNVPRTCFNPVPNVDSAVIKFTPRKDRPNVVPRKYFEFLKQIFSQKRKTLKNNLLTAEYAKAIEILKKNNINENVRAEELNEEIIIEIFNKIKSN